MNEISRQIYEVLGVLEQREQEEGTFSIEGFYAKGSLKYLALLAAVELEMHDRT
jgi:hypothetical protein